MHCYAVSAGGAVGYTASLESNLTVYVQIISVHTLKPRNSKCYFFILDTNYHKEGMKLSIAAMLVVVKF